MDGGRRAGPAGLQHDLDGPAERQRDLVAHRDVDRGDVARSMVHAVGASRHGDPTPVATEALAVRELERARLSRSTHVPGPRERRAALLEHVQPHSRGAVVRRDCERQVLHDRLSRRDDDLALELADCVVELAVQPQGLGGGATVRQAHAERGGLVRVDVFTGGHDSRDQELLRTVRVRRRARDDDAAVIALAHRLDGFAGRVEQLVVDVVDAELGVGGEGVGERQSGRRSRSQRHCHRLLPHDAVPRGRHEHELGLHSGLVGLVAQIKADGDRGSRRMDGQIRRFLRPCDRVADDGPCAGSGLAESAPVVVAGAHDDPTLAVGIHEHRRLRVLHTAQEDDRALGNRIEVAVDVGRHQGRRLRCEDRMERVDVGTVCVARIVFVPAPCAARAIIGGWKGREVRPALLGEDDEGSSLTHEAAQ